MIAGSPGGSAIINYVAKTLIGVLDWGLDPQAAIALPNFGSRNGPTELEAETLRRRSSRSCARSATRPGRSGRPADCRRSCARRAAGSAAPIRGAKARSGAIGAIPAAARRMAISAPDAASDRHRRRRRWRTAARDRARRYARAPRACRGHARRSFATHLWKPLLHEVAAGRMDADVHGVDYFLMAYWHHFRFRQGAVIGLDRARRELRLAACVDEDGEEILPRADRALRHARVLRRQRQQRFRHTGRRRSTRSRSTRRPMRSASIAGSSPPACAPRSAPPAANRRPSTS